jgi:hypothetical protein
MECHDHGGVVAILPLDLHDLEMDGFEENCFAVCQTESAKQSDIVDEG